MFELSDISANVRRDTISLTFVYLYLFIIYYSFPISSRKKEILWNLLDKCFDWRPTVFHEYKQGSTLKTREFKMCILKELNELI